jgi:ferredoxin
MADPFLIKIDHSEIPVAPGETVLAAARRLGIDIPTLCFLEKCGPLNSCLVCLVKINGKLVPACGTKVSPGMVVESETEEVHAARRTALELLFSDHVGDCLSPCQRLCPLKLNVPLMLRQIQSGELDHAEITLREALPLPAILGRLCHHPCEQGCRRGNWDDPAAIRSLEKLAADVSLQKSEPYLPKRKPLSGKSTVIVGAGPTGLAAAHYLLRQGHACTVADRQARPGGSLRLLDPTQLPPHVLARELEQLERLGAHFEYGVALGSDLTIDGLLRGFDAVLLATGEISTQAAQALGLVAHAGGIKVHSETFATNVPGVFGAGRAVKPIHQLLRAMADGVAAAECMHLFLSGHPVHKTDRPFSSIMGRLDDDELQTFLKGASLNGTVSPCDACAGFSNTEAATEASRCLHCDCRSSGNCALQSYAQVYRADASRYRQQRRKFSQLVQPCGIIFEPGKCIQCGICVRLTELAAEPLGLTFIGRGFDVRIATPFNKTIEEGLQLSAADCVKHCPTGALTFGNGKLEKPK